MQKLAPNIIRQRLLIEGYYDVEINEYSIKEYFYKIAEHLTLRTYGEPVIYSPAGMGKAGNQGYDAFIPLIDSGISLYAWSTEKFVSIVIYTCKTFSEEDAVSFTKDFFGMRGEMESKSF